MREVLRDTEEFFALRAKALEGTVCADRSFGHQFGVSQEEDEQTDEDGPRVLVRRQDGRTLSSERRVDDGYESDDVDERELQKVAAGLGLEYDDVVATACEVFDQYEPGARGSESESFDNELQKVADELGLDIEDVRATAASLGHR